MLLDLSKLIATLEAHTKALLVHAEAVGSAIVADVESAVKRPRGRPAKDASTAPSVDVAAMAAAAQPAALAVAAQPVAAPVVVPAQVVAALDAAGALAPVITAPTLQQVADAVIAVANGVSRDKAVEILAKYGAKRVPELKPEQFAAVLADTTAALNPSTLPSLV